MKTGRNILIGAILSVGAVGGAVIPAAAAAAPAVTHVLASAPVPNYLYHG